MQIIEVSGLDAVTQGEYAGRDNGGTPILRTAQGLSDVYLNLRPITTPVAALAGGEVEALASR